MDYSGNNRSYQHYSEPIAGSGNVTRLEVIHNNFKLSSNYFYDFFVTWWFNYVVVASIVVVIVGG